MFMKKKSTNFTNSIELHEIFIFKIMFLFVKFVFHSCNSWIKYSALCNILIKHFFLC
jgi:hypothetical protein